MVPRTRRRSASLAGSSGIRAGGRASRRGSGRAMAEQELDELRRSAFAIAYRMLGSVSEAEDVVQEGLLRLYLAREGGERIESPRAYLSTVVSRLALDHLRSARVLREVFDESYDRIAEIIGTSEENARQLAARARRHVEERRPRFEASRAQREELASRFFAAAEEGDLEGLEQLLAH